MRQYALELDGAIIPEIRGYQYMMNLRPKEQEFLAEETTPTRCQMPPKFPMIDPTQAEHQAAA